MLGRLKGACGEEKVENVNEMSFTYLVCFTQLHKEKRVSLSCNVRSEIVGWIVGLKLDVIVIAGHLTKAKKARVNMALRV